MGWVKIDDQFPDHPKINEVGGDAAWLHVCALCYCARYLTDGAIPKSMVERLSDRDDPADLAARLVDAGLWADDGDAYVIEDYLGSTVLTEQREREQRRARVRRDKSHIVFDRDGRRCLHCGATDWLTVDHVVPIARGGSDDLGNLQTLCRSCNSAKGAR